MKKDKTKELQQMVEKKSKTIIRYKARKGAHISNVQAEIYGKRLIELVEKYNGKVMTDQIVEDAQNKKSPLHSYFEWDDKIASKKYRKYQAITLKNSIVQIKIIEEKGLAKEVDVPILVHVVLHEDDEDKKCYVTLERTLSEKDLRNQHISKILSHLQNVQYYLQLLQMIE